MKTLVTVFLLLIAQLCLDADETNIIAVSAWSQPVAAQNGHSLRARMIVAQGRSPAFAGPWPETQFYLEFQNVSGASPYPARFYFDPSKQLHCTLADANGKPPPTVGTAGSGGGAGAAWITLPYDSSIRLRANMFGYGKKPGDGLQLTLWPPAQEWTIQANNTNTYYLSGTFTVAATNALPTADAAWGGTLDLPKMEISVKK